MEDFVDFLAEKQSRTASRKSADENVILQDYGISEKEAAEQHAALASFAEDWDSPEMEVYDKL